MCLQLVLDSAVAMWSGFYTNRLKISWVTHAGLVNDAVRTFLISVRGIGTRNSTHPARSQLVEELPELLKNAAPSDILIRALRNNTFQGSLFLADAQLKWPKRNSGYPSDLVELWEDHRFIAAFLNNIQEDATRGQPMFQFDSLYAKIFQQHPDVLFVLRTQVLLRILRIGTSEIMNEGAHYIGIYGILRHLGVTIRIFSPFLELRNVLPSPFQFSPGDSPLDFLSNPNRAGELYSDSADTIEDLILFWIFRAKEFITHSDAWPYTYAISSSIE
ncbi:hypothetical protein C8R43DRAFT_958310 [Mycena crocata]|nr:hypothetical protein C8R43DRAFT_958310 [Mycena crocata]